MRRSPSHFALCFFCPYLPFCRAKIPSLSVTGLSYLSSSLLASRGLRNSGTRLPACVPLPREGRVCGEVWCWGFALHLRWRGHSRVQAPRRGRGSFGMLYCSLPRELMPRRLLCCPRGCPGAPVGSRFSLAMKRLGGKALVLHPERVGSVAACMLRAQVILHHCCLAESQQRLRTATLPVHGIAQRGPWGPPSSARPSSRCLAAASASRPVPGSPRGRGCPSIRLSRAPPLTASALSDADWEIIAIIIEIFCS